MAVALTGKCHSRSSATGSVSLPCVSTGADGQGLERWRRVIGHDGHLVADLRIATPEEGGRGRAVQSGYHAVWWVVSDGEDTVVGSGPIDLLDEQRSIKPGQTGRVAIHPMDPVAWQQIGEGNQLHLRERPGQTLGVATVRKRVGVPEAAPLQLDALPLRPGQKRLVSVDEFFSGGSPPEPRAIEQP